MLLGQAWASLTKAVVPWYIRLFVRIYVTNMECLPLVVLEWYVQPFARIHVWWNTECLLYSSCTWMVCIIFRERLHNEHGRLLSWNVHPSVKQWGGRGILARVRVQYFSCQNWSMWHPILTSEKNSLDPKKTMRHATETERETVREEMHCFRYNGGYYLHVLVHNRISLNCLYNKSSVPTRIGGLSACIGNVVHKTYATGTRALYKYNIRTRIRKNL